ncbi:MAG: AtpZ/AtpI family protein [Acidimicrobiia bacterium]
MDLKRQTATWQRGLGDGFSLAVEFVVAPLIFAALGWWLDSRLGTSPVFAVALGAFAFVAVLIRTYYSYMAQTAEDEKDKPWTRSRQ